MSESSATPVWVESMGGPLIVIPASAVAAWQGCTEMGVLAGDETAPDDYDRACEVDGWAAVIAVGGAQGLVLADEPATTCYLPEHRAFVRWYAADSEDGLIAEAEAVLADPATEWEECGTWTTDGPAVLMDSANAGGDLNGGYPDGESPQQAPVPVDAGRWQVWTAYVKGAENWVGLVQLRPIDG